MMATSNCHNFKKTIIPEDNSTNKPLAALAPIRTIHQLCSRVIKSKQYYK
ncbi:18947_t:CDS:1, partial [Funneliformis geosporum]